MNTEKGVADQLLHVLKRFYPQDQKLSLMDIPCGEGEFMNLLKKDFPHSQYLGSDIVSAPKIPEKQFLKLDATQPFDIAQGPFDVVISVSGVTEFDNTSGFIKSCMKNLRPGGRLIITNDNIVSVRDRLSFLLFGRIRRFSLFFRPHCPTFKMIPIQELYKIVLEEKGEVEQVKYFASRGEDWALLPLGLPLILSQLLYLWRVKAPFPMRIRRMLFPLSSFFCRHYLVVIRKSST